MISKAPYICGALTELPVEEKEPVKAFYSQLADICQDVLGRRAFVPHECYDPAKFAEVEDVVVYDAESSQVKNRTSLLVVVYIYPSWGGGGEIELAGDFGVPVLFLCPAGKRISRYPSGSTKRKNVFQGVIVYENPNDALLKFRKWLKSHTDLLLPANP